LDFRGCVVIQHLTDSGIEMRRPTAGQYREDVALVFGDARGYAESHALEVKRPAVVLDIK
jgi:hypothetical protein